MYLLVDETNRVLGGSDTYCEAYPEIIVSDDFLKDYPIFDNYLYINGEMIFDERDINRQYRIQNEKNRNRQIFLDNGPQQFEEVDEAICTLYEMVVGGM